MRYISVDVFNCGLWANCVGNGHFVCQFGQYRIHLNWQWGWFIPCMSNRFHRLQRVHYRLCVFNRGAVRHVIQLWDFLLPSGGYQQPMLLYRSTWTALVTSKDPQIMLHLALITETRSRMQYEDHSTLLSWPSYSARPIQCWFMTALAIHSKSAIRIDKKSFIIIARLDIHF